MESFENQDERIQSRSKILSEKIEVLRKEGAEIVVLLMDSQQLLDVQIIEQDLINVDYAIFSISDTGYFDKPGEDTKDSVTYLGKRKAPVYLCPYIPKDYTPVLQIDLEFVKGEDGKKVIKQSHKMVKITKDTPEDPKIKEMVDEFAFQLP